MSKIIDLISNQINLRLKFPKAKPLFLFVCLFHHHLSYSQAREIDSLQLVIKNAKHDTVLINSYIALANTSENDAIMIYEKIKTLVSKKINESQLNASEKLFLKKSFAYSLLNQGIIIGNKKADDPKAIVLITDAEKIYQEIENKKGVATCLFNIASIYAEKGQIQEAINYYKKCVRLKIELKDKLGIIDSFNGIANIYADQGKVTEALNYYQKSLKLAEEIDNKKSTAACLNNIANIYSNQGEVQKAFDYYQQSLKLCEELKDKRGIANELINIGIHYAMNENNTNEALSCLQKALALMEEMEDEQGIAYSLLNLAGIYKDIGQLEKAINCYRRGLSIEEKLGNKQGITYALSSLSEIYFNQMNLNKALKYGLQSLKLAQELGYPQNIEQSALQLKNIYQKQHDYKKAFEMHELYITMRDSISNDETRKATYKSQLNYEYEKKALADSIKVADEKKVTSAQLAESAAKLKQEKTQRFALYGGLLLVLIFTGFIFNRFKITQKQKGIIEQQKKIVDESQRKIVDSINYAKKIQYSILPSVAEISHYFPQHFIYFKPKDIVSGDFYWFHHHNNLSFFAVVDCTGHGVPGAFMTMIAHSLLNEVILEQNQTRPDIILSQLHSMVFKALQQQKGDEYSQDGMDMSLCVIDHQTNQLHFSGARNSSYIIHNKEITTLKATLKSIGGLSLLGEVEPERKFKLETLTIKKDSLLILSTDGLLDQMNEQDEKLGTSRFKELLKNLDSAELAMSKTLVDTTFNAWKNNAHQLDDVLLVGIKL